jgi:hypothetical protein
MSANHLVPLFRSSKEIYLLDIDTHSMTLTQRSFFASLIFDIERGRELLASISYSQRLSDTWKLNTGYRYIDAPQKGLLASGLEPLDKDNQLSLTITRFF